METPEPTVERRQGERRAAQRAAATELSEVRRELDAARRQLELSEARFRDIIEHNADAIVVLDAAGTIRFVNQGAAELFGVPRERLVGSPFGFPTVVNETTEVDILSALGERVAEMRVVASRWDGMDAQIASLRDVTERKRAELDAHRLIRAEAGRLASDQAARRFRFLAEAGEALSATLDAAACLDTLARLCVSELADWVVVYAADRVTGVPRRTHVWHRDQSLAPAAAALRDLPIDAAAGHPVVEVLRTHRSRLERTVSEDDLARASDSESVALARRLGVRSYMLIPIVARERSLGAIALTRGPNADPFDHDDLALAEQVAARAGLAMDNAHLYAEANRANQSKADFLAVVSHDLRTPLSAIMGYADLLLMGMPDPLPDSTKERIARIKASASHVNYLINELLSFARLDAGREEIRPQQVDLRTVLKEVQSVVEPLASSKQLALAVDTPPAPAPVVTDPDKARQILLNLVGNAIKYTPSGRVTVRLVALDSRVEVSVQDTGPGIAPNHLDRIFDPFWQVDPTQRTHGGGTGLGLSVVKRLAELLGGAIRVNSALGQGSEFTLSLPLPARSGGGRR